MHDSCDLLVRHMLQTTHFARCPFPACNFKGDTKRILILHYAGHLRHGSRQNNHRVLLRSVLDLSLNWRRIWEEENGFLQIELDKKEKGK